MMTTQTEALKLALEALNHYEKAGLATVKTIDAITAIKEALAQQCVCGEPNSAGTHRTDGPCLAPQRTWVGLTEEEINKVLGGDIHDEPNGLLEFVRAIEAKLKQKNGYAEEKKI